MIHISSLFFFFNDTATTEIYTLSLHDALPISKTANNLAAWPSSSRVTCRVRSVSARTAADGVEPGRATRTRWTAAVRSEEHTSELQSRQYLVCRLLLEKKKKNHRATHV